MHGWSIPVVNPGTAVAHSLDRAALPQKGRCANQANVHRRTRLELAPKTDARRCMSTAVTTERDLHALAADAGLTLSPQLLGVVLELLRLDVTPQAVLMMLRRVMVRSVELQRAPQ